MKRYRRFQKSIFVSCMIAIAVIMLSCFAIVGFCKMPSGRDLELEVFDPSNASSTQNVRIHLSDTTFSGSSLFFEINSSDDLLLENCDLLTNNSTAIEVNGGNLTILDSRITNVGEFDTFENTNVPVSGGAIKSNGGSVEIRGSLISGHRTSGDGGAICANDTAITLAGVRFENNMSNSAGGAIFANNSTIYVGSDGVSNTNFDGNSANYRGGAISLSGTEMIAVMTTFNGNALTSPQMSLASGQKDYRSTGGAVYVAGKAKSVFESCVFTGNSCAFRGGAIYVTGATVDILGNTTVDSNFMRTDVSGSGEGAGIMVQGGVLNLGSQEEPFTGSVSNNISTGGGGGIYVTGGGNAHQYGGTIFGNQSTKAQGGGVYLYSAGSKYYLHSGSIVENRSKGNGAGVYLNYENAYFEMTGGEISNNITTAKDASGNDIASSSSGGGIYVNIGELKIAGGEISGNTATSNGGGVFVANNIKNKFSFVGGEIAGNVASGHGGGVYLTANPTSVLGGGAEMASISDNVCAGNGAGIFAADLNFSLQHNVSVFGNDASNKGDEVFLAGTSIMTLDGGEISSQGNAVFVESSNGQAILKSGVLASFGSLDNTISATEGVTGFAKIEVHEENDLSISNVSFDEVKFEGYALDGDYRAICYVDGGRLYLYNCSFNRIGLEYTNYGVYAVNGAEVTLIGDTSFDDLRPGSIYAKHESVINLGRYSRVNGDGTIESDFSGIITGDSSFEANQNSVINMYGGTIKMYYSGISLYTGSTMNFFGGKFVDPYSDSNSDDYQSTALQVYNSTLNMNGTGVIAGYSEAIDLSYSTANLVSGTIEDCVNGVDCSSNSTLNLSGQDFEIKNCEAGVNIAIEYSSNISFDMSNGSIDGCDYGIVFGDNNLKNVSMNLSGGVISGSVIAGIKIAQAGSGCDVDLSGVEISDNEVGVLAEAGSLLSISGGKISGNNSENVTAQSGAKIQMSGGTISGNQNASGVVLSGATLEMSGGQISGDGLSSIKAQSESWILLSGDGKISGNPNGTGVDLSGSTFDMSGGEISGNMSYGGGGVLLSGSSILNMTGGKISGNQATYGAGIYVSGASTLNISDGEISGNTASTQGGGIFTTGKNTVTISGGEITVNKATSANSPKTCFGGGIYLSGSTVATISGGTISGNESSYRAGGIYSAGSTEIFGKVFIIRNKSGEDGAGIFVASGNTRIPWNDGAIAENVSQGLGGGIYVYGSGTVDFFDGIIGETTVDDVYYAGNKAKSSGAGVGMYSSSGGTFNMHSGSIVGNIVLSGNSGAGVALSHAKATFNMSGGVISGNKGENDRLLSGTGVKVNSGTFKMTGGTITGHQGTNGAGVYVDGSGVCKLSGGSITGNTATSGAGVYVNGRSATFEVSGSASISGNTASTSGSGVYANESTINVVGGSIDSNLIETTESDKTVYGAGIYGMKAIINISGGKVSGNKIGEESAGGTILDGAGIYGMTGTKIVMTGGEISGNIANAYGGGIHVNAGSSYTLNSQTIYAEISISGGTISGNKATSGAGVYMNATSGFVQNTAKFTLSGGTISGNTSVLSGGGIEITRVTAVLSGSFVVSENKIYEDMNHSDNSGMGAGVAVNGGKVTMSGGRIEANQVQYSNRLDCAFGGGLYVTGSAEFLLSGGTIQNNIACPYTSGTSAFSKSSGGNVFVNSQATLVMTGGTISGNGSTLQAQLGGGIANLGVVRVQGGTIEACVASTGGGIGSYGGFKIESDTLGISYNLERNDLEVSGTAKILNCVATLGEGIALGNKITLAGNIEIGGTVAVGATEKCTVLGFITLISERYPSITVDAGLIETASINLVFVQGSFNYSNQTYNMKNQDTMIRNKYFDKNVAFATSQNGSHSNIVSAILLPDGVYWKDLSGNYGLTTNYDESLNNSTVKTFEVTINHYDENMLSKTTVIEVKANTVISTDGYSLIVDGEEISPGEQSHYVFEGWKNFETMDWIDSFNTLVVNSDVTITAQYIPCLSALLSAVDDSGNHIEGYGWITTNDDISPRGDGLIRVDANNSAVVWLGDFEVVAPDIEGYVFSHFEINGETLTAEGTIIFDNVEVHAVYNQNVEVTVTVRYFVNSIEQEEVLSLPIGTAIYIDNDGNLIVGDRLFSPGFVTAEHYFDRWEIWKDGAVDCPISNAYYITDDVDLVASFVEYVNVVVHLYDWQGNLIGGNAYIANTGYIKGHTNICVDERDPTVIWINGENEKAPEFVSTYQFSHYEDSDGNIITTTGIVVSEGYCEIRAVYALFSGADESRNEAFLLFVDENFEIIPNTKMNVFGVSVGNTIAWVPGHLDYPVIYFGSTALVADVIDGYTYEYCFVDGRILDSHEEYIVQPSNYDIVVLVMYKKNNP